jgi:hypothetical protein
MMTRMLAVALAVGSLTLATAHAQTSSSPSSGSMGSGSSTTTTPSTPPTAGTGSTSSTMGGGSSTQQAQQPMGAGSFDPTKYKTKTECLNAATAAHASASACSSLK